MYERRGSLAVDHGAIAACFSLLSNWLSQLSKIRAGIVAM
jgi:hypothetical protein